MALRTILKKDTDEESLRKKSRPVTVFDQRLHNMIDDMVDTLKDSGGVGLAAPQVGILRRIVVIEKDDRTILELVNPEIIDPQGEQEGLIGRCFVHECEHLDGILFVDRASKILTEEDLQRMEEEGEPEPGSEEE